MHSTPFNLLDELYFNLDRRQEPWVVHLEARMTGRLEPERLAAALAVAVGRHPMSRARVAEGRSTDRQHRWEILDRLCEVPLHLAVCEDDEALAQVRERHFAFSPSLDVAPPFAVLLAHVPGGDALLLNVNHAAADGIGAVRLMRSILRAYAGEDDPMPAVDPLAVRDVRELAGAASAAERVVRAQALARHALCQMVPAARVARDGGDARPAYGFEFLSLSPSETAAVADRRTRDATVNDVLIAALAVAITRWNQEHGRAAGRVSISMPVNLRPQMWRTEVVANFASYVTVSLAANEQADLARAIETTSRHTGTIKRDDLSGTVIDLLAGQAMLSVAARRRLQDLIPLSGDVVVDTASLSNLGVLETLPSLGEAGSVREMWFSPPGRMPLGAAIGVLTVDGRLRVTLRYRHAQFDRDAARAFLRIYRDVVLGRPGPATPQQRHLRTTVKR
ncbi:MAG: hypothetical protein JWO02_953 [Solirubrobacterales bacterium]|nr:hypothetical protein [Solirubrobacterales bacterium]